MKYSPSLLHKLEGLFSESDFHLRYEKGQFRSGYCVLKDDKIILVNQFASLEGKIDALVEILRETDLETGRFSDKSKQLLQMIRSEQLELPT